MMEMRNTTTITVTTEVKQHIVNQGAWGETLDTILRRLLGMQTKKEIKK